MFHILRAYPRGFESRHRGRATNRKPTASSAAHPSEVGVNECSEVALRTQVVARQAHINCVAVNAPSLGLPTSGKRGDRAIEPFLTGTGKSRT